MKKLLFLIATGISITQTTYGQVYVDASAGGANNGTSWVDAYTDLNIAIANTSTGEIWVKADTYYPGTSGANSATFMLKDNVSILGGFNGTETMSSQRDPATNITILSGDLDQSGTHSAADAYHVVSTGNVGSSASLNGFTITMGNAVGTGFDDRGAGIINNPSVGGALAPLIDNCKFIDNYALLNGGGAYIICYQTGGNSTGTKFNNCIFENNSSGDYGGGVYVSASGTLAFCIPTFENCLFLNNLSSLNSHHVCCAAGSGGEVHPQFIGCTFYGNGPNIEISFNANGTNSNVALNNCIAYGLDLYSDANFDANYCDVPNSYISGGGNIDANPLFVNEGSGDFRLQCSSPCRDAGDISYAYSTIDLAGNPRNNGLTIDIGAYETNYTMPMVIANATDNMLCPGDVTMLFGSGDPGLSFSWSGGAIDGSPFSPFSTETFTVTGTDANLCSSTDMITITVNPLPSVMGNVSAPIVCEGDMVTLYGSGTATNYSWDNGVLDNVAFSAFNPGPYMVIGTDMGTGCVATAMVNINIESNAGITGGMDQGICAAGLPSINLNAMPGSATSYTWTTINGTGTFGNPLSPGTNYDLSPADLLQDTIKFVINLAFSACPSYTDTVNLSIYDVPTVSVPADYTICETDSIQLQGTVTGGTTPYIYNWVNGSFITVSTANNEMYQPLTTDSYTLNVTDAHGCYGADPITVTVDASENISGYVNNSGTPLSDGIVYLIRFEPQNMVFDTLITDTLTTADNGIYSFPPLPFGNYLIKVVPDAALFTNLLPTYYGNTFQWDSATVINHNCTNPFTANVDIVSLLGGTGSGIISGFIIEDVGFNVRNGNGNNEVFVPGGPLKGIDVKLGKNPSGGIQARTTSDNNGYYEFNNLPDDSYRIYVDIPGLGMDSLYIVNITPGGNTYSNLNYYADSNSVYPIAQTAVGIKNSFNSAPNVSLYPNPAKTYTSIVFESTTDTKAKITVMDPAGKAVMHIELKQLPKGKHEYQLNFDQQHIASGIYFINVQSDSGIQVKKLIIE